MKQLLLTMSLKEISRLEVVERIRSKRLTQTAGAVELGISRRQMIRLCERFASEGAAGLISRKRGKPSNNRLPTSVRKQALTLLQEKYRDFGPTLAQEKLTEQEGLRLSVETVRQLMQQAGLWQGRKRKPLHSHPIRTRRSRFGELIQIDGSEHDWFEGRAPHCCLLVFIDDATSRLQHLQFVHAETTQAYFDATRHYLKQFGRPCSFYSDRHSIFRVNIKEAASGTGETQFSRAIRELGIELICANSPQAKGRVEKANRTLQDRLVKELRLQHISCIESANAFLPTFIADYNQRFAVKPSCDENAHRQSIPEPDVIELLFSKQTSRTLSKNLSFSYQNTLYQIQLNKTGYTMRGAQVTVCDQQGLVTILYKGKPLRYQTHDKNHQITPVVNAKQLSKKILKPSETHPWRKPYKVIEKQIAS